MHQDSGQSECRRLKKGEEMTQQANSLYKLSLSKLKFIANGLRINIGPHDTKRTLIRKSRRVARPCLSVVDLAK